MNSGWAQGDWNGDGDFDSGDLVAAFQDGGYEKGLRLAAVQVVPEPSSTVAFLSCFTVVMLLLRRSLTFPR